MDNHFSSRMQEFLMKAIYAHKYIHRDSRTLCGSGRAPLFFGTAVPELHCSPVSVRLLWVYKLVSVFRLP